MTKHSMLKMVIFIFIFLQGCALEDQPNVPKAGNYMNKSINKSSKSQKFEEDSLRCEIYANDAVSQPHMSYVGGTSNTNSGNFNVTNMQTGQRYNGQYNSYNNGGFSSGFARGAMMGQMSRLANLRRKAWRYCMMKSGWRKK